MATTPQTLPPALPPIRQVDVLSWMKRNLFSSWWNSLLTVVALAVLYWFFSTLVVWSLTQAQWQVVAQNLRLFFVGRYPINLLWRLWLVLGILSSLSGLTWGMLACHAARLIDRTQLILFGSVAALIFALSAAIGVQSSLQLIGCLGLLVGGTFVGRVLGRSVPGLVNWLFPIWVVVFFVLLWLLEGGIGLRVVRRSELGGLVLTVLTAIVGIVISFPFGVLLALGRQSSLPLIKWFSIGFIEIVRGLPLIGILFMSQLLIPLLLPADVRLDTVTRAIAGLTIFSAAYLAENVRGGLQSIPRGQVEASKALGLNPPLTMVLIVLPQALKAVIPTIVGQFISLFKDTSLLAIVGLRELLGIAQATLANPQFLGRSAEVYLVIGLIYFVCCYAMSIGSRRLERQLGGG